MNEKINKVCKVVIQVCSVATAIAQVVAAAFPVAQGNYEQSKLVKEFMEHEELMR